MTSQKIQVKLTDVIAPSFYDLHWDVREGRHTYYKLSGGRGSTKSSFCSVEIIRGMMEDAQNKKLTNAVAFRRYAINLHDSVYEQLVWAIDKLGVSHLWKQSGYKNIHPNCRHSIHPYIESLQTPEEVQADIEQSNRPFEDNRDQKQIDLYNQEQAKNRQIRQDLYQYERYKTRLGEDAPKSLSAFRRVKNKGGSDWDDLQYYYKYKGDRPTYCVKIDRELEKLGVNKGKAYPADNAYQVKSWNKHAIKRLQEAGVSEASALEWKNSAKIMLKQYPLPIRY